MQTNTGHSLCRFPAGKWVQMEERMCLSHVFVFWVMASCWCRGFKMHPRTDVMLCTVQCRPASACARKSPPRRCTLKKQDKTRQEGPKQERRSVHNYPRTPNKSLQPWHHQVEFPFLLSFCSLNHDWKGGKTGGRFSWTAANPSL